MSLMKAKTYAKKMERYENYNKNMVLTPVAQGKNSASNRDYNDQIIRRNNKEMHCWDDSKDNKAVKGDLFGYVENCIGIRPDIKTHGRIELFKILNIYNKTYRLPEWSENVGQGDRNVVELSNDPIFVGSFKDFKDCMGYSDNYNLQGTRYIKSEQLINYYDNILYKTQ